VPRISPAALAERRQRILEAAARCAAEGGPGAVTARRVAAEAGISVGALYHHFAGLDALWAALAEQRLVAAITEVAGRAPAGQDPLAWAVGALVCAPPLGVLERSGGRPEGVARVAQATVDEVLRASAAIGGLRRDVDQEALAELLDLLWEAVDRRSASTGLRTSTARLAATLEDVLDRGCRLPSDG